MRKLITITLIFYLFLAGCDWKLTVPEYVYKDHRHEVLANRNPQTKEQRPFNNKKTRGTIFSTPVTCQSTTVSISVGNLKSTVTKINYHIWRTADDSRTMKIFPAVNPADHFTILLDTRDFASKRGEYQIEAYSVDNSGKETLLSKSVVIFPQRVPILMYHAVDEYKGQGWKLLFVSPANFERQMQYLKDNGYTLLTFERFSDINKVNKPIFVTFDDGMKNNMNALKILKKLEDHKFKPAATEFVIAGRIDSGSYSLSSTDIKEMVNSGIFSIQSHTMSHSDLRSVTDYVQELKSSKEKIEQVTGKPVIALAYPMGYFNEKVVEETEKYYKFAVTTKYGLFVERGLSNELFLLHRIPIHSTTTIPEFATMIR